MTEKAIKRAIKMALRECMNDNKKFIFNDKINSYGHEIAKEVFETLKKFAASDAEKIEINDGQLQLVSKYFLYIDRDGIFYAEEKLPHLERGEIIRYKVDKRVLKNILFG